MKYHKMQVPQVGRAKEDEKHQKLVRPHHPRQKQKVQALKEERDNQQAHFVLWIEEIFPASIYCKLFQESNLGQWMYSSLIIGILTKDNGCISFDIYSDMPDLLSG